MLTVLGKDSIIGLPGTAKVLGCDASLALFQQCLGLVRVGCQTVGEDFQHHLSVANAAGKTKRLLESFIILGLFDQELGVEIKGFTGLVHLFHILRDAHEG